MLLFLLSISNVGYGKNDVFFSEDINNELKKDLAGFLKWSPNIEEVLSYSEYKKIILFIDSPFSFNRINQASELKNPFLLIETLDVLSYNLKLKVFFSDWYLSKLFSYVKEKPGLYMLPYLRFCQKSDGAFAEGFADPLAEIMNNSPKEFSESLQRLNNMKKICGILATGDYELVSGSLKKLADYNKTKNIKMVNDLFNCVIPSFGGGR